MIKLKVNNYIFENWLSVKVTRSLAAISGKFEISYTSNIDDPINPTDYLSNGDQCTLLYKDKPLITGYIDEISNSLDNSSVNFNITGRDKTGDLVDSANIENNRSFKNISLKSMAEILASPFGIRISDKSNKSSSIINNISLQQNETIWESISKLAKYQGVLAYPDHDGGIIFSDVASSVVTSLKQGENISSINFTQKDSEKFQIYRVYVNVGSPTNKHKKEIAEVIDNSVKRPRVKQVPITKLITLNEAKERAKWEMAKQIAKAFTLSIDIPSWEFEEGKIWEINTLVSVDYPVFKLKGDFLIEETNFSFDENGFKTELKLVIRDAYNPTEVRNSLKIGEEMSV
jgi:prophage tail gpP-like protein